MKKLFKDLFTQKGYESDNIYDWTPLLKEKEKKANE